MKLLSVLLVASSFALTAVACGGDDDSDSGDGDSSGDGDVEADCVKMCEMANACPDAEEQDCDGTCDFVTVAAEAAGCDAEWVALVQCANDNDDVACEEESDVCDAESEAFDVCLNDFGGMGGAGG